MAQKGIREYHAKKMLTAALKRASGGKLECEARAVLVTPKTNLDTLEGKHPWLKDTPLVVKPDQLFGKRGKNNLIYLNKGIAEAKDWIKERMNKDVTITQTTGRTTGTLDRFLIEPFRTHEKEYYVAVTTQRDKDILHFSPRGGVDIEEIWDTVVTVDIPIFVGMEMPESTRTKERGHWNEKVAFYVDELLGKVSGDELPYRHKDIMREFLVALYGVFVGYHFTYLEFNPFSFEENELILLDAVAKVDDYASFQCAEKWGKIEFPKPFGMTPSPEEKRVEEIDSRTGASLKLTVLNPTGRVWNLVAGGGASVIYADTVVDLGFAGELANYGEYSGNPSTEDTYEYTKTLLDLMTRQRDPQGRAKFLLIGGGIANFTDVAKTFTGIIKAIEDYQEKMRECNVKVFVRRGGPNYTTGLRYMKELGKRVGLPIEVFGPETHMTKIVSMALKEQG